MAHNSKSHRNFSFMAFQAGLNAADRLYLRFRGVWLLYAAGYVTAFLGLVVVTQLLYPTGISTPRTSLGQNKLGFATAARISTAAQNGPKQIDLLAADGSKTPYLLEKMGLTIDGDKTAKALTDYPLKQRFVPFSIFRTKKLSNSIKNLDAKQLATITPQLQELFSEQPVNAVLVIDKEQAIIVPEKYGVQIDTLALPGQVEQTASHGSADIVLPIKKLIPKVVSGHLNEPQKTATKILNKKLTITAGNFTQTLTSADLQNWVSITGGVDEVPAVAIEDATASEYIDSLKKHVEAGGIPAQASYLDNEIQLVAEGRQGQAIVADQTLQELKKALLSDAVEETITVTIATIQPGQVNQYQYSQTSKGLQALLTNALQGVSGRYYGSVEVLSSDDGRAASIGGDVPTVSASLYKLFVANVLFEYLSDGRMQWETVLSTGQTVDHCFEQMIVHSQDRCAISLAQTMGWATIDERLQALGYSNTRLNNYNPNGTFNGDKKTSVQDLMKLLKQLNNKTLVQSDLSDRLISAMKRQSYRSGIPKGARSAVANKVGYVPGYFNDAGIVYGKSKTYALVLMSTGGYWTGISSVTTQLENYFGN
ncbi:MAG: serine hydrolase [Patescibacteria group bacterium]